MAAFSAASVENVTTNRASVEVLTKRGQFIISSLPFSFRKIETLAFA